MAKSKEPPYDEAEKCMKIRIRSKSGTGVESIEEVNFCMEMFKKYPNWYKRTERDVFNAAVPFGSNAHVD